MKYYNLLFLPGIIFLLMPVISAICAAVKAKHKAAEKAAREEARREALRKAKEEREAAKAAEEAAKAAMPKRKPGRPRKNPLPEQRPEIISPADPAPQPETAKRVAFTITPVDDTPAAPAAPAPQPEPAKPEPAKPVTYTGNNAFAGQTVAFTGTLPGMIRREAIAAVEKNGGKAFETMPAATTLLVVGDNPGRCKLDKADDWSVRKITAAEFFAMLNRPLTFEPDEFAEFFMRWAREKGVAAA